MPPAVLLISFSHITLALFTLHPHSAAQHHQLSAMCAACVTFHCCCWCLLLLLVFHLLLLVLQRFHRLTSDKRMWLVVAPSSISPEVTPSGRAGLVYPSLKAAVAASR